MLPVLVVTLHLPPVTDSGTLICPVLLLAIKTLDDRRLPVMLPVLVFNVRSVASQLASVIAPVFLDTFRVSAAMTFVRMMSPVVPVEVTFIHRTSSMIVFPVLQLMLIFPLQFIEEICVLPVETEKLREPAEMFSAKISPVVVLMRISFAVDAWFVILPVLREMSML